MCPAAWPDEISDIRAGQELARRSVRRVMSLRSGRGRLSLKSPKANSRPVTLLAFLRSTHSNVSHPGAMPNPGLTEQQIDQISAYLGSLRTTK